MFGITTPNIFYNLTQGVVGSFTLDFAPQIALADAPAALLDNIDQLLTHGMMSSATRAIILKAMSDVTPAMVPSGSTIQQTRTRLAVYLTAVSPDFAILK